MSYRTRQRRTSADIEFVGRVGTSEKLVAEDVFIGQQKASGWIRFLGFLILLGGIALFFVSNGFGGGAYEFAVPAGFTFKGGFAGLLVLVGAFLIWQSTPRIKIRIIQRQSPSDSPPNPVDDK